MLPAEFLTRMAALLGAEESSALAAALEETPLTGLRLNPLKLDTATAERLLPWSHTPVPWCPTGWIIDGEQQPGKHPLHAAGAFYLQEPAAMAVAESLRPQPGELILDLAAAPGGKTTHLIGLSANQSTIIANEIEASRTRALGENLERWGARRAVITSADPARLAERWGACFDRVLLDAPCSGEGMFRKSAAARTMWSAAHVQGCAVRQSHALAAAAALVKPGGVLVYSTCTFAPEEDEQIIAQLCAHHPDFSLEPLELAQLAPGRPDWLAPDQVDPGVAQTGRIWPHRAPGEGHFIARLRRSRAAEAQSTAGLYAPPQPPRAVQQLWREFIHNVLGRDVAAEYQLLLHNEQLYAVPPNVPLLQGVRIVRGGWWLGSVRRDRFEPAHSLALGLTAAEIASMPHVDFAPDDEQVLRYLQGHPLAIPGAHGWLLITVAGLPLGWGRRSQNIIKNAYPKGLRWH